jgi:hypothetical protein
MKNITRIELQAELNRKLRQAIGNDNLLFGGVMPLVEVDSDGSNWSPGITMIGLEEDVDAHRYVIQSVISDIRAHYNLVVE